jgi:P27 family predicted phage terminase small subunit
MGRPNKSVKLLSKNLTKEEKETRESFENKIKGNGDKIKPPKYLTNDQKKIFQFIVDELEVSGILGNLDIYLLETAAIAIDRIQTIELYINEDIDNLINKSLMSAKDKYSKDFFKCCTELCLSPQSRAKLGNLNIKAHEDSEDPLLRILNGGKQ